MEAPRQHQLVCIVLIQNLFNYGLALLNFYFALICMPDFYATLHCFVCQIMPNVGQNFVSNVCFSFKVADVGG